MVSVIVPVYNKEKEVKQCIQSIICQTYSDLEVVVINDGSSDSSLAICEKLAETDQRINVYSKKNEGVEKARLFGLEKCHGDYVTFVDSDDWISKKAIEILVGVLEANEADVSFGAMTRVLNRWKFIKRKNVPDVFQHKVIDHEDFIQKYFQSFSGWGDFPVNVTAKLYKKELLSELESVDLVYGEDLCFNMQILPKVKRIVSVPDNVYFYRWGGNDKSERSTFFRCGKAVPL